MKKIVSSVLIICILSMILSGCSIKQEKITGEWYNSDGKCLSVSSDGSWQYEDSLFNKGTWKYLEDKVTVEFTDFYGDTYDVTIEKNELGAYIDFNGTFYKNSYPSEEKISEMRAKNAISINPFEGIKYEISGISPYCQIAINNQGCSEEAQKYVTYTLDKENYANGETAVITAELSSNTGEESYVLTSESSSYQISNQPEYLTSLDGVDISKLKSELSDRITAEKSATSGSQKLFEVSVYNLDDKGTQFDSCDDVSEQEVYLSTLKPIRLSEFDQEKVPYNIISFIYSVKFSWSYPYAGTNGTGTFWLNISAWNVVKYPDGSIKWGTESTDAYNFVFSASKKGLEDCISTTVMSNSDNYNITKITQE